MTDETTGPQGQKVRQSEAFGILPDHWHDAIATYTAHGLDCGSFGEDGGPEDCDCAVHQFRDTLYVALAEHLGLLDRRAPVERLRRWVDDLQSGMYVNCVYCGHRYGPGETTPVSMADALKAHVEECPEHPMSALRAENDRLRAALATRGAAS